MVAGIQAEPKLDSATAPADEEIIIQQFAALSAAAISRLLRSLDENVLKQVLGELHDLPGGGKSKRELARQRVLRSGKIIYDNRSCLIDCQIRDMSISGCRVRVANTLNLPGHFELQIIGVAQPRLCGVRWRTPSELGLQFLD